MNATPDWLDSENVGWFVDPTRNIANICPDLADYLRPGQKILDAGCGAGSIALEAAGRIRPGSVVGVDASEAMLEQALAKAQGAGITNAEFVLSDVCELDFEDDTFDLAYAVNVLGWLDDPVKALRELKRVTKPGGWVLQIGTEIWETAVYFPPCPAVKTVISAYRRYRQSHGTDHLTRCREAGLKDVSIRGMVSPLTCVHAGSPDLDYETWYRLMHSEMGRQVGQQMIARGLLDTDTQEAAIQQIEAWHSDPNAYKICAGIVVAGRVGT
jgi:SAM-dependent methyltransferase